MYVLISANYNLVLCRILLLFIHWSLFDEFFRFTAHHWVESRDTLPCPRCWMAGRFHTNPCKNCGFAMPACLYLSISRWFRAGIPKASHCSCQTKLVNEIFLSISSWSTALSSSCECDLTDSTGICHPKKSKKCSLPQGFLEIYSAICRRKRSEGGKTHRKRASFWLIWRDAKGFWIIPSAVWVTPLGLKPWPLSENSNMGRLSRSPLRRWHRWGHSDGLHCKVLLPALLTTINDF